MSRFALISSERKKEITDEITKVFYPSVASEFNRELSGIFGQQSQLDRFAHIEFKLVYKNSIFKDPYQTYSSSIQRVKSIQLSPKLHPRMDALLAKKEEADKEISKLKTLLSKIFLKAKNEREVYDLLPKELQNKFYLIFDLNDDSDISIEVAKEFLEENKHLMPKVYEQIFVGQITGKL